MVNEGINLAGVKNIIESESVMSNMAIEVAKLRIEVDALLESNPEKAPVVRLQPDVIDCNTQKSL